MATALYSMQMPNGTPPEPIMSISDFSCPASALPNGQTSIAAKRLSVLRKGVCFSMTEPWSGEAEILPEALYDFVERVRGVWLVVVIEEVSVMTLRTLVALDQRLRADTGQVFRRDQHYADGGFSTAWPHPTTKHVRRVVQTDVIGTNASRYHGTIFRRLTFL
ncbi:hypothetical protein VYU27_000342 [Nannochloropsis oceanica]